MEIGQLLNGCMWLWYGGCVANFSEIIKNEMVGMEGREKNRTAIEWRVRDRVWVVSRKFLRKWEKGIGINRTVIVWLYVMGVRGVYRRFSRNWKNRKVW
jgi:hypothetical protein